VDGGIQVGEPGRTTSTAKASGLPLQESGGSRTDNRTSDEGRQDQGDGRGSSDWGSSGTSEGLHAVVAQGAETIYSGDRKKSFDLSALNRAIREGSVPRDKTDFSGRFFKRVEKLFSMNCLSLIRQHFLHLR